MTTLARTAPGPEGRPCSPRVARILLKEPNASSISGLVTKELLLVFFPVLNSTVPACDGVSKVFQRLCF